MAMGRPKAVLLLDAEQREQLEGFANSRSFPAGLVRRAKIVPHAPKPSSANGLLHDALEPNLHLIEPGGIGRSEYMDRYSFAADGTWPT